MDMEVLCSSNKCYWTSCCQISEFSVQVKSTAWWLPLASSET
jgi:hypothetical protein